MDLEIDGNVALVTASSVNSETHPPEHSPTRAHVVVNGRDKEQLDAAAEELRKEAMGNARVVPIAGDLTEEGNIENLVETTLGSSRSSYAVPPRTLAA